MYIYEVEVENHGEKYFTYVTSKQDLTSLFLATLNSGRYKLLKMEKRENYYPINDLLDIVRKANKPEDLE